MTFNQSISSVFSKFATFSGRASRSEYWWFYLFVTLVSWGLNLYEDRSDLATTTLVALLFICLLLLIPSIAVAARRLHDSNRSGWWLLLSLTVVGIVVVLYWLIKPGDQGANDYGAAPA